jgi:transcriptional regulator with XRE-family HTH domain
MKFIASPAQLRAARSLLGWSQAELGKRAGISANGVSLIESGRVDPHVTTLEALVKAFEEADIEFIAGDDADPAAVGVTRRSRKGLHSLRRVGSISPSEAGLTRLGRAFDRINADMKDIKGAAIHGDGDTAGMLDILRVQLDAIVDDREAERLLQNIAYAIDTAFDLGRVTGEDRALKDPEGR